MGERTMRAFGTCAFMKISGNGQASPLVRLYEWPMSRIRSMRAAWVGYARTLDPARIVKKVFAGCEIGHAMETVRVAPQSTSELPPFPRFRRV
jgi:hypothetical protein